MITPIASFIIRLESERININPGTEKEQLAS